MVKPKKHLGQHFLTDPSICKKIADAITGHQGYTQMLEIGPGTGALTKHLIPLNYGLRLMEVDRESIAYLAEHYPDLEVQNQDILKSKLDEIYTDQVAIVGNFPYNISSQIMFKVLEYKTLIPEVVGMFQKEVAQRICEKPGSKAYGILSVLIQAYYKAEYLFTVDEDVFDPPPKVKSGVLRLTRLPNLTLPCDEALFVRVVKLGFNQRRKTLRNSLKSMQAQDYVDAELLSKRPEQLDVNAFIQITQALSKRG